MSTIVAHNPELHGYSLQDLSIQPSYRTGTNDLVAEFYVPCLSRSVGYDRTAGYFDTKALERAADGIAALVANGGRMRLVVSPRLRKRDVAALTGRRGWSRDIAATVLSSDVPAAPLADWLRRDRYGCTAWLVANGLLDVRVAFRETESGIPFSHYHEKIGLFTDPHGDVVAFSGSVNETGLAWDGNFESVDTFRSWRREEQPRVEEKTAAFEHLWANETPGVVVKPMAESVKDGVGAAHVWNSVKAALARRV